MNAGAYSLSGKYDPGIFYLNFGVNCYWLLTHADYCAVSSSTWLCSCNWVNTSIPTFMR